MTKQSITKLERFIKKVEETNPRIQETIQMKSIGRKGYPSFSKKALDRQVGRETSNETYRVNLYGLALTNQRLMLNRNPQLKIDLAFLYLFYEKWQAEKTIFRFDRDFFEEIKTQQTNKLPTSVFNLLPYEFFFIEAPFLWASCSAADNSAIMHKSVGAWVLSYTALQQDAQRNYYNEKVISLLFTYEDGGHGVATFSTEFECMEDIFNDLDEADNNMRDKRLEQGYLTRVDGDYDKVGEIRITAIKEAINCLLYLCAKNGEIQDTYIPSPQSHSNPKKKRSEAHIKEVGYHIGMALRSAKTQGRKAKEHQGGTVRAHIRRSHWHHYWTGAKDEEQTQILKWLSPTLVKGTEDNRPTVHRMKNDSTG